LRFRTAARALAVLARRFLARRGSAFNLL